MKIQVKKNWNESENCLTKWNGVTHSRCYAKNKTEWKKVLHRAARRTIKFEME